MQTTYNALRCPADRPTSYFQYVCVCNVYKVMYPTPIHQCTVFRHWTRKGLQALLTVLSPNPSLDMSSSNSSVSSVQLYPATPVVFWQHYQLRWTTTDPVDSHGWPAYAVLLFLKSWSDFQIGLSLLCARPMVTRFPDCVRVRVEQRTAPHTREIIVCK